MTQPSKELEEILLSYLDKLAEECSACKDYSEKIPIAIKMDAINVLLDIPK